MFHTIYRHTINYLDVNINIFKMWILCTQIMDICSYLFNRVKHIYVMMYCEIIIAHLLETSHLSEFKLKNQLSIEFK